MEVPLNGDHKYFITFLDDFSQEAWVQFLKKKEDAYENFKIFKAYVEKQSGYIIKILRKDRDIEYTIYDYILKKKVTLNINQLQDTHYNKIELQREKIEQLQIW